MEVRSSNLRAIGYDPSAQLLEIEFRSGAVYAYQAVLPSEADGLMASESKGKYFASRIRDRYQHVIVRGPDEGAHDSVAAEGSMDRDEMIEFAMNARSFADSARESGGSAVIRTRDYGSPSASTLETRAFRNQEKEGARRPYFSFAPDDDVSPGDVIGFKVSKDLWLVTDAEDQVIADIVVQRKVFYERFSTKA